MKLLSRSEEIILLAIWRLQDNAYGVTIRQEVMDTTGQSWSIGAIYAPLHRLEKKGLVATRRGVPEAARGGRSKIFYSLTPAGKQALVDIKKLQDALWIGIPSLSLTGTSLDG